MTIRELLKAYFDKFDEGPPIREMDEPAAIAAMEEAIETGVPMESKLEEELPDGALN